MNDTAFSPATPRPQDVLVSAFKHLGGVAHLKELSDQCKVLGYPQPEPSIRRLCQQFSSDAVWSKSQKPANAKDLFYSVDGVQKSSGFWGLRGFAVENPSAYPIPGLRRSYTTLLDRVETTLFNQRGIAYRDAIVVGIQVGFAPEAPYPDKLLPNGRIEHIGEGRGNSQQATGGNKGMLDAIESQFPIPVFQSVGPKGKKRYAELGSYRVASYEKRPLRLEDQDDPTDAYVFTLEPVISLGLTIIGETSGEQAPSSERGGFELPIEREISEDPPVSSGVPPKTSDPEARRQAQERRSKAHHDLVVAFKARAKAAKLSCVCTQYADALCDGDIFEMKSLEQDETAQVRATIGQLYHYMFIHRNLAGYEAPRLFAVFDGSIDNELAAFIIDKVNIGVIWRDDDNNFHGDAATQARLPWLFA